MLAGHLVLHDQRQTIESEEQQLSYNHEQQDALWPFQLLAQLLPDNPVQLEYSAESHQLVRQHFWFRLPQHDSLSRVRQQLPLFLAPQVLHRFPRVCHYDEIAVRGSSFKLITINSVESCLVPDIVPSF